MKVLILNNFAHNSIGGAELYSYNLIQIFKSLNWDVNEITIFNNENVVSEPLCPTRFVINKPYSSNWISNLIKLKFSLIKETNKNKYDLIVVNTIAWPFLQKIKARSVFIQHSEVSIILNKKKNFLRRCLVLGSAYNYVTDIVSYTKESGKLMVKKNKRLKNKKFWDALLFCENTEYQVPKIGAKYITFIGRDMPVKRLDLVCELSEALGEKIRIVTDSENPEKFNKYKNIEFLGFKTRKEIFADIIPTSKFVILLSEYEGTGFVLVESLSFGVPIICRNSFLLASFLVNGGSNGILLPKEANVQQWAKIINANMNKKFSQAVIRNFHQENMSRDVFVKKWTEIIKNNK